MNKHAGPMVVVVALFILTFPGSADRGALYDESANGREQIKKALETAKESNKLVLITWGANWCGWCHHLEEQVQGSAEIQRLLRENYVSIHIDLGHRDKHMELAREYGLEFNDLGIPYVTVHDVDGTVIGRQSGADRAITDKNGERVYSPELIAKFLKDYVEDSKRTGTHPRQTRIIDRRPEILSVPLASSTSEPVKDQTDAESGSRALTAAAGMGGGITGTTTLGLQAGAGWWRRITTAPGLTC